MPRKLPPKNSSWVQLTKDFVKEWPEILDGLQFQNMPVKYLHYVNIILKNNVTIHYDIKKSLKDKKQDSIARFLKKTIEQNNRSRRKSFESIKAKYKILTGTANYIENR